MSAPETPRDGDTIDWQVLRERARAMLDRAYVPYSRYPVGAAALTDDGRIVAGCNVENASIGLSLCAECGLISALHAGGGGRLTAFTCVDRQGEILMPCGRCRQLLSEHAAPGMLLETVSGIRTMDQLLPDAFGPANLTDRDSSTGRDSSTDRDSVTDRDEERRP